VTEQRSKKDDYQKALAAYGQAMKAFHKGDFEKAASELKSFIEKFPGDRELVDRAQIYLAISQKKPKKESVHPKTFEDHFQYGVYKINSGDFEGALKLLEKALEFKTDEAKVLYLIANIHCLMNNPDACLENLKKAVQKDKTMAILALNETDFEPLWEDKRFKAITQPA
jgi:tetratricopeptide (TPR) repeat protein